MEGTRNGSALSDLKVGPTTQLDQLALGSVWGLVLLWAGSWTGWSPPRGPSQPTQLCDINNKQKLDSSVMKHLLKTCCSCSSQLCTSVGASIPRGTGRRREWAAPQSRHVGCDTALPCQLPPKSHPGISAPAFRQTQAAAVSLALRSSKYTPLEAGELVSEVYRHGLAVEGRGLCSVCGEPAHVSCSSRRNESVLQMNRPW